MKFIYLEEIFKVTNGCLESNQCSWDLVQFRTSVGLPVQYAHKQKNVGQRALTVPITDKF